MQRPTVSGNYTEEDLRKYAQYRKDEAVQTIRVIMTDAQVVSGEISPEEHEEYCEPLALSRETVIDVQLSTGGDADGFRLTFIEGNELVSGVYYWADWGVYEEIALSNEELEQVDNLYAASAWIETR